jgi:protein-S-isoprenylcysteine O-methyltransferase Ste14
MTATPPTFLLAALLLMLVLHFLVPGARVIQPPWSLLGLLPLGFGVGINLAADRELHRVGTTVKPFEVSACLVSGGVYRFSRHPMYLGFIALLAGVAILLGSLSPWLVVPVFFLLLERIFIRVEEAMLAERFGEAWGAYTRRVRRWF